MKIYEELFEDSSQILGPHDEYTLVIKNNLASVYISLGNYAKAMAMYEEILEEQMRISN
jgi:tetratricopeptide (TPR) repeat protein